jgi:hypothetical protein
MVRELIESFRKPSAETLAQRELDEAKRQLLTAQSHQEYYKRLADYNHDRVMRLTAYLKRANGGE